MIKRFLCIFICVVLVLFLCSCSNSEISKELNLNAKQKDATQTTKEINDSVYSMLDFSDKSEYENATRGLIDAPESLTITREDVGVVWSQDAYSFVDNNTAPDTANPSLWENTKNNHVYGLFEVTDRIYQVRGYDLTNLTVIEGDTGYIVFDPMMSVECAQASLELVYENLGKKPIKAIIISHSHVDHFGGIKGVMSEEQCADSSLSIEEQLSSGKIPIIVPDEFEEFAVSENLYAGGAMQRRANYQYGTFLKEGEKGTLSMGIGMAQSSGLSTYISPTYEIKETGEVLTIDGVKLEFQLTPGTEAPSEMNTWLPDLNALWVAENCTSTLHNLYTLRGAQVRDGEMWARYILETISLYGDEVEVVFQSHNWPHWENKKIIEYLTNTAAVYKYINDQTLTYINLGYTSDEIAHMIKLPSELEKIWYTRQYYGTVAHNAKAVYQKYMGFYDANPVSLNALPKSESAKKWVEYLGDTDEVLRKAKKDFDKGEYQWVAEITNVLVYADPQNTAARFLCADALEQLGYQAESGTWRNVYLSGALELRLGNQGENSKPAISSGDSLRCISAESMLQYMAIKLDKEALKNETFTMNIMLSDTKEEFSVLIKNGVFMQFDEKYYSNADVEITCPKNALFLILNNDKKSIEKAVNIKGDAKKLYLLSENMNTFDASKSYFNIIEP